MHRFTQLAQQAVIFIGSHQLLQIGGFFELVFIGRGFCNGFGHQIAVLIGFQQILRRFKSGNGQFHVFPVLGDDAIRIQRPGEQHVFFQLMSIHQKELRLFGRVLDPQGVFDFGIGGILLGRSPVIDTAHCHGNDGSQQDDRTNLEFQ